MTSKQLLEEAVAQPTQLLAVLEPHCMPRRPSGRRQSRADLRQRACRSTAVTLWRLSVGALQRVNELQWCCRRCRGSDAGDGAARQRLVRHPARHRAGAADRQRQACAVRFTGRAMDMRLLSHSSAASGWAHAKDGGAYVSLSRPIADRLSARAAHFIAGRSALAPAYKHRRF